MRIWYCEEKANDLEELLLNQWPLGRRQASARDVLSVAGKLWNFTYVVRTRRYFVRRLLRLTGLHDARARQTRYRMVEIGRVSRGPLFLKVGDISRAATTVRDA